MANLQARQPTCNRKPPAWCWTAFAAAGLLAAGLTGGASPIVLSLACIIAVILALTLNPGPIRRAVLGAPLLALFRKILPQMSSTEKEALDAKLAALENQLAVFRSGIVETRVKAL